MYIWAAYAYAGVGGGGKRGNKYICIYTVLHGVNYTVGGQLILGYVVREVGGGGGGGGGRGTEEWGTIYTATPALSSSGRGTSLSPARGCEGAL